MSTKTHCVEYRTQVASQSVVHLVYDAYGHNQNISETVLPHVSSLASLVNLATCELKFH